MKMVRISKNNTTVQHSETVKLVDL